MIEVKSFFDSLKANGIRGFSGVPDSLLKDFCAYVSDNTSETEHTITANEGSAVALAVGQYLSTGQPSLVYMQNSGIGNAINPLLSLADAKVYGVPMLLMVGWRGEPGVKDEPQHIKQGAVMTELLDACQIPHTIIGASTKNIDQIIQQAVTRSIESKQPYLLLIKKGTFDSYALKTKQSDIADSSREEAISKVLSASDEDDVFVSTTGMTSRELFELRESYKQGHNKDFLTVGSMGHASMIALGVSQGTNKHVFCIDGDGACLMHLGNITTVGMSKPKNLIHILLNNAAHDSVGGQPTCANSIPISAIADVCGYSSIKTISNILEIEDHIASIKEEPGPHFLEIKVKKGARSDLGRPTSSPMENKEALMNYLKA